MLRSRKIPLRSPLVSRMRRLPRLPGLEPLESRRLLAVHVWQGPAVGGSWGDNANWDTGAPTTGEAGGTIVQFNGGIESTQDLPGLVVDQIVFASGGNTILGTFALGLNGDFGDANVLASDVGVNTLDESLPLVLSGDGVTFLTDTADLIIESAISGDANVFTIARSGGEIEYSGATANTYTGVTTVVEGLLRLNKFLSNPAMAGDVVISTDSFSPSAAQLNTEDGNIPDTSTVTVHALGSFNQDNDDIGNLVVRGGQVFTGPSVPFSVFGDLTMQGGMIIGAARIDLNGEVNVEASSNPAIINGLHLTPGEHNFNIEDGAAEFDLDLTGVISGGAIIKLGPGSIRFGASNSFFEGFTLEEGTLLLGADNALGGFGGTPITVNGGAIAAVGAARTLGNGFTANGDFEVTGDQELTLAATILMTTDITMNVTNTAITILPGQITEVTPGTSFTKTGPGELYFANEHFYTGTTFVNQGIVRLREPIGLNSNIRGPLVIGDGVGGGVLDATVIGDFAAQLPDTTSVTVNSDGEFQVASDETIGPLTLNGGDVGIGAGVNFIVSSLTSTGGTIQGPGTLALGGDVIVNEGTPTVIQAPVNLTGQAVTFTVAPTDFTYHLDLLGGVANGSMRFDGLGVTRIMGPNTYADGTTLVEGTLVLVRDGALGTGGVVIEGGTVRAESGPVNLANSVVVVGDFTIEGNDNLTFSGPIALDGSHTITITNLSSTIFDGIVSETAPNTSLTKAGPGTLFINQTNTYTGTTFINDGELKLGEFNSVLAALPGDVVVGDGTGAAASAILSLTESGRLLPTATVTVNSDGGFSGSETIASLVINGGRVAPGLLNSLTAGALSMNGGQILGIATFTLAGDATISGDEPALISSRLSLGGGTRTFTVADGAAAFDLEIDGEVSNGGLTKTGPGTLALNATSNTYTGNTTVNGGILLVNANQTGSDVFVNAGTLGGSGVVGDVIVANDAFVNPGDNGAGVLGTGNLTLQEGATFVAGLDGTTAGTEHDQTSVSGAVTLQEGAVLTVNLNARVVGGAQYVIVLNDGADPVSGIFEGLPEGSRVVTEGAFAGQVLKISYTGGDGNDIVLTLDDDAPSDPDAIPHDGTNENFIRNLYEDVFDRAADQAGLDFWLAALEAGASRNFVASRFLASGEYVEILGRELYSELLGRAVDATFDGSRFTGPEAYYFNLLLDGAREEQVIAEILASDEFRNLRGGTNDDYVASLYDVLLGREADAGGTAYFVNRLNSGATRAEVAVELLASAEFQELLLDDATGRVEFAEGWFQDYFDGAQETSQPGFDDYFARLAEGDRWTDVQADILDSPEYFAAV